MEVCTIPIWVLLMGIVAGIKPSSLLLPTFSLSLSFFFFFFVSLAHIVRCLTCGLSDFHCPGHFGHIELPFPLFNPLLFQNTFRVLQSLCFNCHRFRVSQAKVQRVCKLLHLIQAERLAEASRLYSYDSAVGTILSISPFLSLPSFSHSLS